LKIDLTSLSAFLHIFVYLEIGRYLTR